MTELPASQVGDLHFATVVINVSDMERAVRFWTEALGYEPHEKHWNTEFMMLVDPLDLHASSRQAHPDHLEPIAVARLGRVRRGMAYAHAIAWKESNV